MMYSCIVYTWLGLKKVLIEFFREQALLNFFTLDTDFTVISIELGVADSRQYVCY